MKIFASTSRQTRSQAYSHLEQQQTRSTATKTPLVSSNLSMQSLEQPPRTRKRSRECAQNAPRSTRDDILSKLAKDQNIVSLLQAVVEYVYQIKLPNPLQRLAQSSLPSQPLDDASNRPVKRRRLTKPPAGAEEWVIPFPFQRQDDPRQWQADWETKRLTILLKSLLRTLRDWKGQRGTMAANPPHLTQSAIQIPETAQLGGNDTLSSLLSMSDLADFRYGFPLQPTINGTSENLFDFVATNNNANLPVKLQDLSEFHSPPSQALVPDFDWDHFLQQSMVEAESDPTQVTTPEQPQTIQDVEMVDTSSFTNDFPLDPVIAPMDQNLSAFFPALVADKVPQPDLNDPSEPPSNDPSILSDAALQAILNLNVPNLNDFSIPPSTETSSAAAASFSASVGTTTPTNSIIQLGEENGLEIDSELLSMRLDTPRSYASLPLQTPLVPQMELQQSPQAGPSISTLSKRGKARSTVVLRKDLNKQLRQNAVDLETGRVGSSPKKGGEKVKKVRVNEATLKERENTLEKAKEWKEVLAKQLEKARVARWEVMMEGVVLREMDSLLRTSSSISPME